MRNCLPWTKQTYFEIKIDMRPIFMRKNAPKCSWRDLQLCSTNFVRLVIFRIIFEVFLRQFSSTENFQKYFDVQYFSWICFTFPEMIKFSLKLFYENKYYNSPVAFLPIKWCLYFSSSKEKQAYFTTVFTIIFHDMYIFSDHGALRLP